MNHTNTTKDLRWNLELCWKNATNITSLQKRDMPCQENLLSDSRTNLVSVFRISSKRITTKLSSTSGSYDAMLAKTANATRQHKIVSTHPHFGSWIYRNEHNVKHEKKYERLISILIGGKANGEVWGNIKDLAHPNEHIIRVFQNTVHTGQN